MADQWKVLPEKQEATNNCPGGVDRERRYRRAPFPRFAIATNLSRPKMAAMQYRKLGSSGFLVSPVCLGTMTFGSPVSKADSIKLIHGAMDMGINFIDTANVYEGYARKLGSSGGVAEEILGEALADRRDRAIVATKVGSPNGPGPQDVGLAPTTIQRELDRSLQRLKTDYIDLYIIHWPDDHTPLETTLGAMETAVRQGKILAFGVSNHYAWQLCEFLWAADKRHWPRAVSSQIPYSMLKRDFHNDLEFCAKRDIAVTPYQALQGGLLTGKYRRGQPIPKGSRLEENPAWIMKPDDDIYDQLEATEKLAQEAGLSFSQYTTAWTLAQPAMASLVIGVKTIEQVKDAIDGASANIPPEILAKQDEITPPPHRHRSPFTRP